MSALPQLFVEEADRVDFAAWLGRHRLGNSRLVVLQPGNKRTLKRGRLGQVSDDKAWPLDRWAALIQWVLGSDDRIHIILCGVPAEQAILLQIARVSGSDRVLAAGAELPLRRLLALLERATGMISVDTGPAHAAAALGCPLVVLYGRELPAHWEPRSTCGSTVITLGGPPGRRCVADITLEEVLSAWGRLSLREVLFDPRTQCSQS